MCCAQGGRIVSYRVTLENGVRIVGEEISSMRSVSLGIWVSTGSRYETAKNNGISHFLEHMFFKGTEKYNAKELAQVFDGLGGQVNAFTAKEYTCYYARVLDEHFHTALDTLADMIFHSKFAPEEIEKEKKVVIEEIRMYEDTPDELVMDILAEKVYGSHPLGYTILGTEDNLRSFTRDDLVDYIDHRYRPEHLVVSVAGNVTKDQVVEAVSGLFQGAASPVPARHSDLVVPPFEYHVSTREKEIEQVHLSLASPGIPAGDARLYPLILLNNVLGNTPSSRLFQEIREDRGMAYSVYSYHSSYLDSGMFGIYAGTSAEHVDTVLSLIREICNQLAADGLTEEEIHKAKEQVKGSMMLSLESTSSRMSRIGKNELMLGREVSLDETLAAINAVTVRDVQLVAKEILGQPFAMSAVGPVAEMNFSKWAFK
jgi:predicted Zn-dependent peptidase